MNSVNSTRPDVGREMFQHDLFRAVIPVAGALTLTCGLVLSAPPPAAAQVQSATASLSGQGRVVVRGSTARPHQFVTLNRSVVTRSNRLRRFTFRLNRVPRTCQVILHAARQRQVVPVRDCAMGRRMHRRMD